ncbi:MAG TPA: glycogen debranching protein [Deltaproteobacteria bacterium]|jgi:predicted glycogen debranching enzyme|nr:glycogen debranching protein [Deltaproteobacteria bacterium]
MKPDASFEWLEADGLGGFASGTASGERTRRYHALLLTATTPPTGRMALVSGFDAFIDTEGASFALSSQRYAGDVVAPDGASRIAEFDSEPWPRWIFALPGGARIEHELFVPHGASAVVLAWRRAGGRGEAARLRVRPFFSGRDYHTLQHENGVFRFAPELRGKRAIFHPYPGIPGVVACASGRYEHAPDWWRNFLYTQERSRGLDCLEDLAAPGVFHFDLSSGEAVLIFAAEGQEETVLGSGASAAEALELLRASEKRRRRRFRSPQERAADAYLVRRGAGSTIVAGYPWFTDFGRDTFVALRGLCLATGRLDTASDILLEWAGLVSDGMLPNRFPDAGARPEFNAVDASLWFVVAVYETLAALAAKGRRLEGRDRTRLHAAVLAILDGYSKGTRHGIRCDKDGLLVAGEPGLQVTWMDARIGSWVVTPRIGKPVEVQALWLNALRIASELEPRWRELHAAAQSSFEARFWNETRRCLYDVADPEHSEGAADPTLRPNQIFAVGGLPFAALGGPRARSVVDVVEAELLTPLGLRSLAPSEPGYMPHYRGSPRERDAAYHQGTAWPWLLGPFVEAWVRVRGSTPEAKREASARFLPPLERHLAEGGLGHICEVVDGDAPHTPGGCPFQAWSLGEFLRLKAQVLGHGPSPRLS